MVKVLLVDDSNVMRLIIGNMLSEFEGIEIIGTAENGEEAFIKAKSLKPDVILLDLIMKDYDGLYAVKKIMPTNPTPIIILSGVGNSDMGPVFEALEAGAYDFINKPDHNTQGGIRSIGVQLSNKIFEAAKTDKNKLKQTHTATNTNFHTFDTASNYEIFAIGSSTGGPGALEELLRHIPANFPVPIVIAQHMPANFVHSFAARLSVFLEIKVKVMEKGDTIEKGLIYLAPGDHNVILVKEGRRVVVDYTEQQYPEFNEPSVDALMLSIASVYGKNCIAAILTGMGKDGMIGFEAMKNAGAYTIAQDEKSCVVFGMPKAAIERGAIKQVLPLQQIAGFVVSGMS
jgi:two-component system chemotaxis response regulator CheB